jgi:hypothetical protein
MPVGPGRYRVTTTKTGKKVRLHFTPGGRVNEAKNLKSGAVHTPAEFAADAARRRRRGSLASHLTALRRAGKFGAAR